MPINVLVILFDPCFDDSAQVEGACMAPTMDESKTKEIEIAVSLLGSYRARCSEMLEAARRRRVTAGDIELRYLDFLEKELSFIVAGLTALSTQHADDDTMRWLHRLSRTASPLHFIIHDAGPQRTLLRRAARFFRCSSHRYPYELLGAARSFYRLAEDPCRYRHLLQATSRHGLPPQAAEELCVIMFPYGYMCEKDQLVKKWLCESIFSPKDTFPHISGEKQADDYFTYLVHQNVITHAVANSRRNEPSEAWQWNANHLQHQFLASKSAEMGFVFTSATLNLLAAGSSTGHANEASRIPWRLALHL
jgi:hypothetical protein